MSKSLDVSWIPCWIIGSLAINSSGVLIIHLHAPEKEKKSILFSKGEKTGAFRTQRNTTNATKHQQDGARQEWGGKKPPSLHSFMFQLHPLSSKNCHLIISSVLNAIYAHTSLERGPCSGLKRIWGYFCEIHDCMRHSHQDLSAVTEEVS